MPFFKKQNILFIHIPKTGGTSIENYFYKKFNTPKSYQTLFSDGSVMKHIPYSLQHLTYNDVNKYFKHVPLEKVKIYVTLRNPYDRLISHLFFKGILKGPESPLVVENILSKMLVKENYNKFDNHILPQHLFIRDGDNILENITLIKMENLNQRMKELGFLDFNVTENTSSNYKYKNNTCDLKYLKYLNKNSIELINSFYKEDFILFNYNFIGNENVDEPINTEIFQKQMEANNKCMELQKKNEIIERQRQFIHQKRLEIQRKKRIQLLNEKLKKIKINKNKVNFKFF